MEISIQNLGPIRQASFSLGDITLLCGPNNSGKTYATYALYGFLSYWQNDSVFHISEADIQKLYIEGSASFEIDSYIAKSQQLVNSVCERFSQRLAVVFASSEKNFSNSKFSISINQLDIIPLEKYERYIGSSKRQLFSIIKDKDSRQIIVTLLVDKDSVQINKRDINEIIGRSLSEIVFGNLFPRPIIASAERTGVAIFRKELNFARNRILEEMSQRDKEIDPFDLLTKVYTDYALPIKSNVDFTRQLESIAKKESFIQKDYPEILQDFSDIIGGDYLVQKSDELYYVPKGKKIKLTMDESSSAVRSLLDIGFYLRHEAQKGDLFIVDEPELNLHPENQRRVARLFSRLINVGVKIFSTTHSDYILKEFNTLIMLNSSDERIQKIALREGYKQEELLDYRKVKVYIAGTALVKIEGLSKKTRCQTLVPATIESDTGINAVSFDKTIDEMNRIQDEIIWG